MASPPSPHQQRWTLHWIGEDEGDGDRHCVIEGPSLLAADKPVEVVPAEVAERLAEALAVAHKHIANDHLVLAVRKLDSTLSWYEAFSFPADSQEQGGEDG